MIIKDQNGNELLDFIISEKCSAEAVYTPLTHSRAIVKIGNDFLFGWNHWRKDWEIFGGCIKAGESIRECIIRECREELGINSKNYVFLGMMKYKMAPDYFKHEWHEEYGSLFGISLSAADFDTIIRSPRDKKEIEKIEFYSNIKHKNSISYIDEKLLQYWRQ